MALAHKAWNTQIAYYVSYKVKNTLYNELDEFKHKFIFQNILYNRSEN